MISLFAIIISRTPSTRIFALISLTMLVTILLLVLLVLNGWCNHIVAIVDFLVALCVLLSSKKI